MSDIYQQHESAFASVSAFVLTDSTGARVGTVAFKFPRDGAGRLYCYLHLIGSEMIRGFAGGYGYDKRSAAFGEALRRFKAERRALDGAEQADDEIAARAAALQAEFAKHGESYGWERVCTDAGLNVLQAV